jgi:hypothetical protein
MQWIPEYSLYRTVLSVGLIKLPPAGGLAQVKPITCPIADSMESFGIHERF